MDNEKIHDKDPSLTAQLQAGLKELTRNGSNYSPHFTKFSKRLKKQKSLISRLFPDNNGHL